MIDVTWAQLKQVLVSGGNKVQWFSDDNSYSVFDSSLTFRTVIPFAIPESSDQIDFETNYKTSVGYGVINNYVTLTGNTTNTAKEGPGLLRAIIIGNNNTGGVVTVYDNTSAQSPVIITLQLGSPSGGLLSTSGLLGPEYLNLLNLKFSTGLTITTSGSNNNNITVIYE